LAREAPGASPVHSSHTAPAAGSPHQARGMVQLPIVHRGAGAADTSTPSSLPTSSPSADFYSTPQRVNFTVRNTFIDCPAEPGEGEGGGATRRNSRTYTAPPRLFDLKGLLDEDTEEEEEGACDDEGAEEDDGQDGESGDTEVRYLGGTARGDSATLDGACPGASPAQLAAPSRSPPPPAQHVQAPARSAAGARSEGAAPSSPRSAPKASRQVMLQIPIELPEMLGGATVTVTKTVVSTQGGCALIDLRVRLDAPHGALSPMRVPFPEPPAAHLAGASASAPGGLVCAAGDAAAGIHAQAAMFAAPGGSPMVCCHWKNKGWCKYQAACKFSHPEHKRGVGAPRRPMIPRQRRQQHA